MISPADGPLTIRRSREDDALALRRLAELDSARVPDGVMLLAEVDDELRAAVALDDGKVIADPFHRTRHIVDVLECARREEGGRRASRPVRWAVVSARMAHLRHAGHRVRIA